MQKVCERNKKGRYLFDASRFSVRYFFTLKRFYEVIEIKFRIEKASALE